MDALRELFTKKDTIPIWSDEDCLHYGDQVLSLAILKGNVDAVELLIKNNTRGYIKVPEKYVNHQSNTGYIGISTFGHAIRTVSESRGNREGDAAFYRRTTDNPMEIDTNKCLKSDIFAKNIMSCTHELPSLSERNIIDSMMMAEPNIWNGVAIYFLAASGNYLATASIIEGKFDPTWYNHLHISTLSFVNNEDLPTYRRNQITKKLVSGGSLTPLECSAINPSARYLKELFEKAEPHERVNLDDYGRNVSHFSAANEAPECIEYLISQGFNMSTGDKYRLTPLLQAARFGRHRNIKPLLMYLAQEEFPSSESADYTLLSSKTRALHYAAYYGHTETCLALIECGATIEAVETKTKSTPLIFAAQRGHVECVRLLLQRGANIEARDKFSRNPLHLAVKSGHYEVVYHLLEQGADANVLDTSCNTPAHYAAAFGYIKVLQLLIVYGGADPTLENAWKRSPCAIANLKGHTSVVQYLLSQTHKMVDVNFKDENGNSMIHQCVSDKIQSQVESDNNLYKIRMLLMRGANPNLTNIKLETPLHCLAKSPYFKNYFPEKPNGICFDEMIGIEYHQKLVDILTGAGADINIENRYEETPLAVAMHNKNHIVVKALIQKGAQYWIDKDRSGNNFFHYFLSSAAFIDGRPTFISVNRISRNRLTEALEEVYQSVLEHPAEKSLLDDLANAVNDEGYTPFIQSVFMALKYQEERISANKERLIFAERFIGLCKSDFNATVQLPKSFMEENPKAKISDYPENVGYGALQLAAVGQDEELLEFLLLQGCDPNQVITTKKYPRATALSIGYAKKRENLLEYLPDKSLQTIEYAKKLFNIRKPDFGELQSDFVKLFAKYGVNPCIPEKEGVTALMNSARSLDSTLLSYLCESATNLSADIDTKDDNERTALMYALDAFNVAFKSNERLNDITPFLHLLSSGANFNMLYQDENTVLMKAIRAGIPCIVNALLSHSKHPVDWDIENRDKETVLILAFKSKNTDIVQRCIDYALPVLRSSIHIVNHCDEQQNNILALLLDYGADVSVRNKRGQTSLHLAIEKTKHHINASFKIEKILLDAGADINAADDLVKKNDDELKKKEEIVNHYTKKYGSRDLKTNKWIEDAKRKSLTQKDESKNMDAEKSKLERYGNFEWERSVGPCFKSDHINIVKFLSLSKDILYDIHDCFGRTPIHYSACTGAFSCTSFLLEKDINIDAEDEDKNTPLHLALLYGYIDYSIMLCNRGANVSRDIFIPDGQVVTLIHYTLSAGFMNLAYLILDKDIKALEFIRDALRTGKFELADMLLHSINDSTILESITSEQQNLWHTISCFIPYDFEVWNEYILGFLDIFSKVDLKMGFDVYGRSPAHYAAMNHQEKMLSTIIQSKLCSLGVDDKDGNSELYYAVLSNSTGCVKMLLGAGVSTSHSVDQTRKSLVLMATEHKNIEMLKMLLDSGIEVRNDEQFEKAGAITVACLNNTIEILKILLEAGANPNAISNSFSSKGHTKSLLFMSLSNRVCDEKLHLLLKHKVDLNTTVVDSQRSIFYQYYFDLKRKVEHKIIYENMLQYSLVDINVVDSVTKATPLEIAIRENNAIIVERLLEIEANPNIESCKVLREKEYSLYSDKVNAIFHTILQNQPAILILIHEKSRHPVNWFAQDEQGRTILVRLINGTHEYSYESEQMLTNIHNIMGEKFFDLLKIPDNEGNLPSSHALSRFSNTLYNTLVGFGMPPTEKMLPRDRIIPMEIDSYISLQRVEEDADAERKNMQDEKDSLMADGETHTPEDSQVDDYSNLRSMGYVVFLDEKFLNVMLRKIDISTYSWNVNINPNKYPILKSFDFNESCVKSTLPRNLKNTMRIVCDYEHLQKAYKRVHLDIHNGQVSQKSLDDALEMLDKIERLKEEFQKNYVRKPRHEREIEKKKLDKEIAELSTACYRILPRMSSQNGVIDSLKNEDHMSLEIAKIADLSYLNFAANVALAAKHHKSEIYPLDYVYQALGCSLQEITADGPSGREYNLIRNYMTSTSYKADYEITHLFSVDRQIERQRFSPFENNPNRKLLWHGSNVGNIVGILNQGLRCKPASADEHMFIPLGPSVARTLEETSYINYDEYIVHDAAQVKIRYLVLVKNSKCCSLCQKSFEKSEIKPLKNYMLRNYDYSLFNEYETEILKLLLITTDMKLKQVFDRYLDEFIDGEEYLKKWNPLVGFSAENNTCSNCSDLVAAMTLMKYVESSIEHIPDF
ncbi:ankyrin repeat-containing domain protein [Spinellus fusiger]|nr:ankyrin repeat-containing domain protein [Spinellus fusiger]